jgi:predicted ATPase with chaperone activity
MTAAPPLPFQTDTIEEHEIAPPVPEKLADTGVSPSIVEGLILKFLFYRGDMLGRDLAAALGLKYSVIEQLIDTFKRTHLIQAKRSLGMGDASAVFALSETGRVMARDAIEKDQYVGPVPVPLHQYSLVVRHQRPKPGWLTRQAIAEAYRNMVITPRVLAQIGPAVSSGNALLIYGQPGNGKTFLAESLQNLATSHVFIPNAIECQGNIVQVFDPVYHHVLEEPQESVMFTSSEPKYDGRWIKCKRPFIVTGGELTLDMLDLSFNANSRVYDAPFQVKCNNGIYLIDDFGRQRVSPAEVLNRWIVPMERRVDYLSFASGGKMTVPFEAFLIFSTNLKPEQLGDEAFLRRIQYKMLVRSPDHSEFLSIFERFCSAKGLACPPGLAQAFIERHYVTAAKPFRRCQPRDIVSHAIDIIHFEDLPFELTADLLDRAFESCFAEDVE